MRERKYVVAPAPPGYRGTALWTVTDDGQLDEMVDAEPQDHGPGSTAIADLEDALAVYRAACAVLAPDEATIERLAEALVENSWPGASWEHVGERVRISARDVAPLNVHETAEEAADCPTCSPSDLPRRIEGGDDRLFNAIDAVARRIVADEWDRSPNDLYLDDLELTDDDARAIVRRAWDLTHRPKPDDEQYKAACEFLARRAGDAG